MRKRVKEQVNKASNILLLLSCKTVPCFSSSNFQQSFNHSYYVTGGLSEKTFVVILSLVSVLSLSLKEHIITSRDV